MSDDNNKDMPSAVDDAATAQAESAAKKEISEEEALKKRIEELRRRDPFIYQ
jgi:hypothetical protein